MAAPLPPCDLGRSLEQRVEGAVHHALAGQRSLSMIAKHFSLQKSTLSRAVKRVKEGRPAMGAVGRPLALGGSVEKAIVQFFVDCANANLPQPRANLKEIALAVADGMGVSSFDAGKRWRKSFLERHSEEIDARSPRPFPSQRDKALTLETILEWSKFLRDRVYLKYFGTTAVDPRRLFNMDESPFKMGLEALGERVKVLAASRGEDPRTILGEFAETFTGIAFVCADGSRPLDAFITRGSTLSSRVYRAYKQVPSKTKTVFAASEKVRFV